MYQVTVGAGYWQPGCGNFCFLFWPSSSFRFWHCPKFVRKTSESGQTSEKTSESGYYLYIRTDGRFLKTSGPSWNPAHQLRFAVVIEPVCKLAFFVQSGIAVASQGRISTFNNLAICFSPFAFGSERSVVRLASNLVTATLAAEYQGLRIWAPSCHRVSRRAVVQERRRTDELLPYLSDCRDTITAAQNAILPAQNGLDTRDDSGRSI